MATKRTGSRGGGSAAKRSKARGASSAMIDERSTRDIIGVALGAGALALMIMVVSEDAGVVGHALATALKMTFGVGAYLLPVGLLLWGVSFFVRADIRESRTGIGLAIVVLSAISLVALYTPNADKFRDFLDADMVKAHGGWVGGFVAGSLYWMVKRAISAVILSGTLLAGLVVVGFSISGLVDRVRSRFSRGEAEAVAGGVPKHRAKRGGDTALLGAAAESAAGGVTLPAAANGGGAKKPAKGDPESGRKTTPTPKTVGPRAMEGFELPPVSLLSKTTESAAHHRTTDGELRTTAGAIVETFATFDIPSRVTSWTAGPTVTLFEIEIAKGVKLSRITALADDLALSLASSTVRILAPIPGKALVGIEVPNERRSHVTLGDVLSPAGEGGPLLLGIGKDVAGTPVQADLATMPHLLLGGTTGSGKSVAINAMLMSIMMRSTPSEVRLILIDPKRVELSLYNGVPHLYVPVITEPKEAASALAWSVQEMERRLRVLQGAGARNIGAYNGMVQDGKAPEGAEELPFIVIVIDELADLMMVAAKEVEDSICRIAQLARAAGIHLVVATQRPEANVVTGLIKANITNRIAFNVASSIDSRVVLDAPGAEKLVGLGDMLFSTPAWPKPHRIQGCYVAESEIEVAVAHLKQQCDPEYHDEILQLRVGAAAGGGIDGGDDDPLIWEAAEITVTSGIGSTSMLQRRLKVGYARAGRIMDMLEAKGIVGPAHGSKPREVLVDDEGLDLVRGYDTDGDEF